MARNRFLRTDDIEKIVELYESGLKTYKVSSLVGFSNSTCSDIYTLNSYFKAGKIDELRKELDKAKNGGERGRYFLNKIQES